jgi:TonB family protein
MKRTMLAILALSPVLLHAQSKSPAQPESTPVLQSTNLQPAIFAAGKGAAAAAATTPVRVSTGVVFPVLVHKVPLTQTSMVPVGYMHNRTVDVAFVLDASGKPTDIRVVKSAGALTDQQVVSSVSEYRYKPATLDGQPTPIEVTLSVNVQ